MPSPLDGLRKASSIGASTLPTSRPFGDDPGTMRGEMPLGPVGGGIIGGPGGATAPAIEALKDIWHNFGPQATVATASEDALKTLPRLLQNPVAATALHSMGQEGPEKYLTAMAQRLPGATTTNGAPMVNGLIEGLFPLFFGK